MELVVRKSDLLKELQLFQGIVERKNTIPILANILLEASGEEVKLAATDLEVGLRGRCPASVAKAGSLTLPAKKFFEIVKELPETDIRIEEERLGTVKVAADRFESRMQTLPKEDFPSMADPADDEGYAIDRKAMREMVAKTQFAMTGEDTRYFLNGALFVLRSDSMSMVATDGHRLALVTTPRDAAGVKMDDLRTILPKKTMSELSRLLADGEGDIRFEKGENNLFFKIDGRLLVSRVIDGQFPAYERVIPKGNDKRVEFERDRLGSAIRRVALLSNERSRAIKLTLEPGRVDIASHSQEFGEAHEQLAVEYGGPQLHISFNAQYVVDFLNAVQTDVIAIEFKDEASQTVMRPAGNSDYDYTYVVMPMRI
ncbi:MAG: DNA polymerase III subunit beta [Vicinamibacterales bacterium]|nr:DNA polymerase III subunit beta [Vicinamibacterales bacterium]